jgi:hypothetical protein
MIGSPSSLPGQSASISATRLALVKISGVASSQTGSRRDPGRTVRESRQAGQRGVRGHYPARWSCRSRAGHRSATGWRERTPLLAQRQDCGRQPRSERMSGRPPSSPPGRQRRRGVGSALRPAGETLSVPVRGRTRCRAATQRPPGHQAKTMPLLPALPERPPIEHAASAAPKRGRATSQQVLPRLKFRHNPDRTEMTNLPVVGAISFQSVCAQPTHRDEADGQWRVTQAVGCAFASALVTYPGQRASNASSSFALTSSRSSGGTSAMRPEV